MTTLCVSSFSIADWGDLNSHVVGAAMSKKPSVKVFSSSFTSSTECINFNLDNVMESLSSETIHIPEVGSIEELDAWLMGLDL